MALLQNGYRFASSGVRTFGATALNNAYPHVARFHNTSTQRNIFTAEGYSSKSGFPVGHVAPSSWMLPKVAGGIATHNEVLAFATFTASIAAGRNISGTFAGAATYTATGQLVVSGSGTFAGVAAFSGNVIAALSGSGTFSGSASFSGAVVAKGNIAASFTGAGNFEAIRYATGSLSGSFAPPVTLEAAGFSSYLLDEEDIETGLTLRQALRLVAAATAGKISGGGTATVTIRNAVADGVDRITAEVDSSGNRTAITYDLD
jgi:hypothetical protein